MSSHSVDPAQPQPESFAFTPEMRAKADVIIARYPEGRQRSAVLPLLDLAQRQAGWLSRAAMDHVAEVLALPNIRVYEVATFYTMYRLRPVGRVHVQLCTSISCALRDSDGVMRAAEEVFGIPFGQSNADCTLEEVECAGACVNGPAAQIGDDYYEDLTYDNAKVLFQKLKNGEPVTIGSQTGRVGSAPAGELTSLHSFADGSFAAVGGA